MIHTLSSDLWHAVNEIDRISNDTVEETQETKLNFKLNIAHLQ